MTFHPDSLPDLTGKVFIVTGGNSGIGYGTVSRLAQHGAHVYLCARSLSRGNDAILKITAIYKDAKISLLEMDHLDLSSVVSAAQKFLSQEKRLDGLINNAGIMCTPFQMSKDGHEAQWQTNYLAHWVFTSHLIPIMMKTSKNLSPGSVRIVNVSSLGHHNAPKEGINFDDTSISSGTGMARYGQSKLANVLHAKTLNRLYGPEASSTKDGEGEIWTSSVDPGLVETRLGEAADLPWWILATAILASKFGFRYDSDKGSWTNLFCAASSQFRRGQSGTHFQRIAQSGRQSKLAKDEELADKLQSWTEEVMSQEGWVK